MPGTVNSILHTVEFLVDVWSVRKFISEEEYLFAFLTFFFVGLSLFITFCLSDDIMQRLSRMHKALIVVNLSPFSAMSIHPLHFQILNWLRIWSETLPLTLIKTYYVFINWRTRGVASSDAFSLLITCVCLWWGLEDGEHLMWYVDGNRPLKYKERPFCRVLLRIITLLEIFMTTSCIGLVIDATGSGVFWYIGGCTLLHMFIALCAIYILYPLPYDADFALTVFPFITFYFFISDADIFTTRPFFGMAVPLVHVVEWIFAVKICTDPVTPISILPVDTVVTFSAISIVIFLVLEYIYRSSSVNCVSILSLGVSMNNLRAVKLAIACGAWLDLNDSCLSTLPAAKDRHIAEEIIQRGAFPRGALDYGNDILLPPLVSACQANRSDIVRLLLDAGADPNVKDRTGQAAIFHTCSPLIVKLLLAKGSTIDEQVVRKWKQIYFFEGDSLSLVQIHSVVSLMEKEIRWKRQRWLWLLRLKSSSFLARLPEELHACLLLFV
eukprot:GILJ01007974.1.p1 GENE.GILJ01007974.1~~GILJ01007974.1.p1  ORF type:complete len:496 (+),score=22.47 GILJ01007974.1:65-1552(+)